jgi:integrase
MTLSRRADGTYEGLWRRKGMKPLHLSLRTRRKALANERYDAVHSAVRAGRLVLLEQLRAGDVTVEQLAGMVARGEPLVAVPRPAPDDSASSTVSTLLTPSVISSAWETVDRAAERYLAWMQQHVNLAEQTKALAGYQLAPFLDFEHDGARIGALALDRVPSAVVLAYQQAMIASGRSPNSITTYMGRVSTLWSWAIEQETRDARESRRAVRELYSPIVPELLFRKHRPRERVLTVQEADRLLAATPDPLLWFVGVGLFAGLRANEALHLRPGIDVDLDIGTITVREQGGWKPKTERSRRLVPMAPSLVAIARRHAERYANESWMMPSPVSPALPITYLGVRKHLVAVVERAELIYGRDDPQGVTFGTLRHTFASHAVMRGVDLYTVSKLLGNTVKMVEDVYADLSPDFKRAAVAKLAGAFTLPTEGEPAPVKPADSDTSSDTAEVLE